MDRANDKLPISSLKKIGVADFRKHSGDVILLDENQQGYIPPRVFIRVTYPESIGEVTSPILQTILDNIAHVRRVLLCSMKIIEPWQCSICNIKIFKLNRVQYDVAMHIL